MGYRWLVLIGQELDAEALVQLFTNKNLYKFYWHFSVLLPDPLCCRFIAIFNLTLQCQCNLLCVSWRDWYCFFTSPVSQEIFCSVIGNLCNLTPSQKSAHFSNFFKSSWYPLKCSSLRSLSKEIYFVWCLEKVAYEFCEILKFLSSAL